MCLSERSKAMDGKDVLNCEALIGIIVYIQRHTSLVCKCKLVYNVFIMHFQFPW